MTEKIKKIIFGYLPGFITGLIICGTISVIAATYFPSNDVTYDNNESGLISTNVQGAIDELYGVCTAEPPAGEQIIENAGLEKDPYECRYFFTGANPNNYITFNDETAGWRIISVECDGTIKIIKNDNIEDGYSWDSSNGSNVWDRPAMIKTYLNNAFLNQLKNPNQIIPHSWSVGSVTEALTYEFAEQIKNENNIKSQEAKIGLITSSEFIRTNSNTEQCGSTRINYTNSSICKTTNWLNHNETWWTITPYDYGTEASIITIDERGRHIGALARTLKAVYPTLYLSSEIKITGGTGTSSDPYEISL